jgi:hypothetical protein
VAPYGVRLQIRNMTLAGRSIFIVDKRGKLAFVERQFGIPQTLTTTPLPGVLDRLLDADIERAVPADAFERDARLTAIRTLSEVLRRDWKAVRARLLPGAPDSADELAGPLMKLPDPVPGVFDLVDVSRIAIQADKEGVVEVSAPGRLPGMKLVAVALKRVEGTWKVLAIRVVAS